MFTATLVVTLIAAAALGYAAYVDFRREAWIVENMTRYGIPHTWLFQLGAAKAAGALGLLVGLAWPPVGVLAGCCLLLFFTGAVITVLRSGWYSHLPYPLAFATPAAVALALQAAS